MDPGTTTRDDEPSQASEAGRGGSVVFGFDLSASGDVYARAASDLGALFGLGQPYDPARAHTPVQPGTGDAMHWRPPADGEDTPPCPA